MSVTCEYIAGLTVDPNNPAHAYAIFNGCSRRFVPDGGVGHVFETKNGGKTWTDISGNLPDIASDALVLSHGKLYGGSASKQAHTRLERAAHNRAVGFAPGHDSEPVPGRSW
jgi:hypothetical protein